MNDYTRSSLTFLVSQLRDRELSSANFRVITGEIAALLAALSLGAVPNREVPIQTPQSSAIKYALKHPILLVPIMRAGISLLPAFLNIYKDADVGFLGIARDETTALPKSYYQKLPRISSDHWVMILEPMVATGGSALLAMKELIEAGAVESQIMLVSVIVSREGIDKVKSIHPNAHYVSAAIDPDIKDFMITPGLGDFGDRYFCSLAH